MTSFNERSAECLIRTFKEGLLSPIAHDLVIRVTAFRVEISADQAEIHAEFDAHSLRVVDAAVDGALRPGLLSATDKRKIEQTIQRDVLAVRHYPRIVFASTSVTASADRAEVIGDLSLHGRTRAVRVSARVAGDSWVAEATLHQPDWGIKPYKALLGTLKVQPEVRIHLTVPRSSD